MYSSTGNEVHIRDQHRVKTTLMAMEMMDYDAFFPFDAETEILQNEKLDLSFTSFDSDLTQGSGSYLIKTIGGKRIAMVTLDLKDPAKMMSVSEELNSLMSEVQEHSDFVVGLSHSPIEVNRALAREYPSFSAILSPYEGETEKIGDVLLAYCHSKGRDTWGTTAIRWSGGYILQSPANCANRVCPVTIRTLGNSWMISIIKSLLTINCRL